MFKSHEASMKWGQKRKKNAPIINKSKENSLELGAMSVDDFMQSGINISDESEDNSDVGETRHGDLLNLKKYKNKYNGSAIDKNDDDCKSGESQRSDSDGAMEREVDSEIGEDENDEAVYSDDFENDSNVEDDNEFSDKSDDGEGGDDDDDDDDYVEKKVESEEDENTEKEGDWTSANFSHKKAMEKLKKSDPEFYKYLQQNDKDLLNFDESDSEEEEKDDDDKAGEKVHKLPDHLEVASDESDYEEGIKRDSGTVTLKMVKKWESELRSTNSKSCETIVEVIHAFHAVVVRVSNDDDDESAKYVVTGGSVFNAVIQLCVLDLQPALKKYLKIQRGKHIDPTKNKVQWTKVKKNVHSYISNLIKLLDGVSSANILAVLLKHLHQMIPFAACFGPLNRPLMKMLVTHWSTSEETVRVVSFLCLLRLTTHLQNKILDKLLKMMYLAFIRNCKFVSPNTLPAINFMRRSLVEMLALDLNISYEHAFLYIRQLAIHLRNAITLPKKENLQAVYNWQFINSVHLWADILGATVNKPQLQPLIYPLVQVTLGMIKLIPTGQYYPLRFHCTKILIELSKRTCVFIPILPFLLEALNTYDFNRPHKRVSMKPMIFTFIIRASKLQMQENGFKDVVIDTVYQQMLEYLSNESNSISFPDLIIPAIVQIKKFLKTCKVSSYCRKMKQMLDKIMQNAQTVEKERQKVNFKLNDQKSIGAWETQLKLKGTPLSKYYDSWSKIHAHQQAKMITQNDEIGEYNLPVLKKRSKEEKTKPDDEEKPVVLFPSDDSESDIDFLKSGDEDEDIVRKPPPMKRKKNDNVSGKKNKKSPMEQKTGLQTNRKQQIDERLDLDAGDIVEDLKWEDL